MPDQNALFAVLGEFRPVVCDRRFKVDQAPVGEDMYARGAYALGDRVHDAQRVFAPRFAARGIHMAAPEIDDFLTLMIDRHGAAELVMGGEIVGERVANSLKPRVTIAMDFRMCAGHIMSLPV